MTRDTEAKADEPAQAELEPEDEGVDLDELYRADAANRRWLADIAAIITAVAALYPEGYGPGRFNPDLAEVVDALLFSAAREGERILTMRYEYHPR